MAKQDLYFKDKFKFLRDTYTNIGTFSRGVREYIDGQIPDRFRSISNIFNLTIDVTQDISTLHLLRQENAENELNIFTAQNEGNIRGLSQLSGHNPVLPISSRGSIRLNISSVGLQEFGRQVILEPSAVLRSLESGLEYSLEREESIRIDTNAPYIFIPIIEGRRKSQTFIVDGDDNTIGNKLYTINLDDTSNIEHYILKVYVNNELWTKEDSLRDMAADEEAYLKRVGYGNQIDIIFGNGISGKKVKTGDVIKVEYLTTNGEQGNVSTNSEFEISAGLKDIQGNDINTKQYFTITKESGFDLGSNGESADVTRAMTGFSSRSLSFARPQYMVSFLSRLSILSHVNAWTDEDDLIFNILALPKLVFPSLREYLQVDTGKFLLTDSQKESIKEMISASRRQWVSTEVVFKDPTLKKYAMYVFIDNSVIYDKVDLKYKVENSVSEIMLNKTFGDVDKDSSNDLISRSDFVNALYDMTEINAVNVDIISEENELAKINNYYYKSEIVYEGAIRKTKLNKIEIQDGDNPNIGLSEIGDITCEKDHIPILRGGFEVYQSEGETETLPTNGVIIFVKEDNEWISI